MAEFKKLSEVETLDKVPEGANAFIEIDGEVKRVPGEGLGGGIKTAIIKSSDYDNVLAGSQGRASAEPEVTYECINMTFEEAYQTMEMGKPLMVLGMFAGEGALNEIGNITYAGTMINGVPCLPINFLMYDITLFWTAYGISTEPPYGDS